jgi:hypothetical protein
MLNKKSIFLFSVLLFTCLSASSSLDIFIRQITESDILSYYYRSEDPSWDYLNFHKNKTREEGTGGHDSTRDYIERTFEDHLGAGNVYIHEFDWPDGTNGKGYNVIGIKKGTDETNNGIWIVGAHYDSYDSDQTEDAPGANDNGTGLVGMLEIVRLIHNRDSRATIIFGAWDAEEPRYSTHSWTSGSVLGSEIFNGPAGSRAWINEHILTDPDDLEDNKILWEHVRGNLNLDMFGYPAYINTLWLYNGGTEWNTNFNDTSAHPHADDVSRLYDAAAEYMERYGYDDQEPPNRVAVVKKGIMQYSDNISFARGGMPSLEYAESGWQEDTHYHKWSDYYRPAGGDILFGDENPVLNFTTMVIRGVTAFLVDTAGVNIDPDIPLPVELTVFTPIWKNGGVELRWTTASETENNGFIVERKDTFLEGWKQIATYMDRISLIGQGYSSKETEYRFVDTNIEADKRYEYRLSEVNYAGTVSVLSTTSIATGAGMPGRASNIVMSSISPNPFNPMTVIMLELRDPAQISLNVFDISGRMVQSILNTELYSSGMHKISWNGDGLASGQYLLQIISESKQSGKEASVYKVMIQK